MSVKIRLARHGKKNHAFFHIVVTDTRKARNGQPIEEIGSYNPNTNPATIVLNSERALYWLNNGAQPSETCRRILSFEGVLLRKHLNGGIAKGAITEEVADQRWNAWKAERDGKIANKKQSVAKAKSTVNKEHLDAEAKVNQERAAAISKRKAEEALAAEEARKAKEAEEAAKAAEAAAAEAAAEPEAQAAPAEEVKAE